ncbi:hypothetical protein Vafri_11902, partial [Volvox africanus]
VRERSHRAILERWLGPVQKKGILVSPGGVRSIWLRNDLNNLKKRLVALETKMAQDGIVLTEAQLKVLEKRKSEKEAHGEIETEHPGYLGAQDVYLLFQLPRRNSS